jgi:hypothetical protein
LRRTWTERGRRYFQYSTDAPIGNEWAFFSANYDVQEGQWDGGPTKSGRPVTIRIFHDPRHTAPLDNMMRSVRASLDYYTKQFAPYRYGHINIVEHPSAPGTGAHADASMISYGQGWAYWIPTHESRRLDLPYAVMGHEMGHQWSLPLAHVEGLPFLAEGLAWYFGIQLVKDSRGGEQLRRLLSFMRGPYVHTPIRRGEPLLRALDPYQAYRKGPFVMYALSEYVGTNPVNSALRRLFEKSDSPGAPSVTTLDLYRELQAVTPDSLTPLLHDFFEVNAFWQLKTDRVAAVQTAANTWQVTFDVRARKMAYDSAGVERELPMTEWVQLGVFGRAEQGHEELSAPLYLQMHRIQSGAQRITVTVSGKPDLAGVDPYHLLDWEEREDDDNIDAVKIETPVAAATRPSKNGG